MAEKHDRAPYYDELVEAFGAGGCPFCRMLEKTDDKYVDALLWEMVNDPAGRDELNRARGYCQPHAWLFVRPGGALSAAIMMQGVLKVLLRELDAADTKPEKPSSWRNLRGALDQNLDKSLEMKRLVRNLESRKPHSAATSLENKLEPQSQCPICANSDTMLKHFSDALLLHLSGPHALGEVYQASDGLCLPHFRYTVGRAASGRELNLLVENQQAVWARLEGELGEFIRKNDHRFRHEGFGDEADSWLRALETVSGAPPPDPEKRGGVTQSKV